MPHNHESVVLATVHSDMGHVFTEVHTEGKSTVALIDTRAGVLSLISLEVISSLRSKHISPSNKVICKVSTDVICQLEEELSCF